MALDDLDLEFEDEEEAKRRKERESVQQDVDLEFSVPESVARARPNRPVSAGGAGKQPMKGPLGTATHIQPAMGEVKKLDEARANASQVRRPLPPGAPTQTKAAVAPTAGANAVKAAPMSLPSDFDDLESAEVVELRERLRKTEFDAEVKVHVAEFKAEFIGEMLGDMKLMEHQINQLLVRINAKHPDLKQEALMIKKILADYTTKKRK